MISLFSRLADSPITGPYYAPGTSGAVPMAQGASSGTTFASFVANIIGVVNAIIPALITIAVLIFFVGLARYVYHSDNSSERNEGHKFMLWGLVALFVLMSLWGILDVASSSIFPS
jgi:hypothetical protein